MTSLARAAPQPHDHARRNVLILALCQALGQTGMSVVMVIAALVGFSLADNKALATLPLALTFTATMFGTIPAALAMRRLGRRGGFTVGAAVGLAGALIGAWAVFVGSFGLFIVGSMGLGVYNAFVQLYRFAAADTASESFKPRAISLVLAGGIVAAVAGPELAKWSRDMFPPYLFVGCYLALAVLAVATMITLRFVEIPQPTLAERSVPGRPLRTIMAQPTFIVACMAAAMGYGVMSLVMTATPLAMMHEHAFLFDDAAFVIQWHALAMFVPSFFTGRLIQRFGVMTIILFGIALNVLCLSANLLGDGTFLTFWGALILLGLGWNFMFIGGTTLLTEAYAPMERAKAQAANDFIVFTTAALASLSSGALQSQIGWLAVNLGMVPPLILALGAVLWLLPRRRGAVV
ncbi:MAG: MFS transporter [Inquilinaceae bacterium]